jgi:hypothetical protein
MLVKAGLISDSPVWKMLLAQEGLPWKAIGSPDELDAEHFSVVLTNETVGAMWDEALKDYIKLGGAAVVSQADFIRWIGGKHNWEKYRYLVPADESVLKQSGLIDVPGSALVHEDGGEYRTDKGSRVLPVLPFGNGVIATVPFDLDSVIRDTRAKRKFFSSPVAPLPSERVSRVPRGRLRLMTHSLLEALHLARGLHYVHLWYFPERLTGVFGLRIDTDHSVREEVQALYSLLKECKFPASWFLHVKAHVGWIRDFVSMEGHEIGVHCYEHQVYRASGLDRQGIAKARDFMLGVGLVPEGFAAPYGFWSDDLPWDLEELGFLYSSEFGFDYDNLPSFPLSRGGLSAVLQVPVHPISPGSLVRDGYKEADMVRYYTAVMDRKLVVNEPFFLYTHPGDGHFDLLRNLFDRVDRDSTGILTFSEYVNWWLERERILKTIDITLEGDEIEIRSESEESSTRVRAAVIRPGGNWSLVHLRNREDLRVLDWRESAEPVHGVDEESSVSGQKTRRLLEDIRTYYWRRKG